jgi:hypothetical protein
MPKMKMRIKPRVSIYDEEKPYKCPYCDHSAKQKIHITRHIKSIHESDKTERPYKCTICNYTTKINKHLEDHMRKIHDIKLDLFIPDYTEDILDFIPEYIDDLENELLTDFEVKEGSELFNPDDTNIHTIFDDKKDSGIIYKRRRRRSKSCKSRYRKSKRRSKSKRRRSKSRRRR